MISLMKGVMTSSSVTNQDKLLYVSSLGFHHSIGSGDNVKNPVCVETILELVSATKTRYLGLQLLEMALQQNAFNIRNKGKWIEFTFRSIKDSKAPSLEKMLACRILSMIIPFTNHESFDMTQKEIIKDIIPFLLQKIDEDVEWSEEACICVRTCLEIVPSLLSPYKVTILNLILDKASCSISFNSFKLFKITNENHSRIYLARCLKKEITSRHESSWEDIIEYKLNVLVDCFCLLPYCSKDLSPENVQNNWYNLFWRTLKTIESLQNTCLSLSRDYDQCKLDVNVTEFTFKDEGDDRELYPAFAKRFRRFVNMCKCLAKLLSVRCNYSVKVPVKQTLNLFFRLFSCCRNEKITSTDQEVLFSFLSQMRLSALSVVESLMVNHKMKKLQMYRDFIRLSLECCNTYASLETVCDLRTATWKLLGMWLEGIGRPLAKEIAEASDIIQAILADISIGSKETLQAISEQKSKSITGSDFFYASNILYKRQQKICQEALNTLLSLLCTGAVDFPRGALKEISNAVFSSCDSIYSSHRSLPFPYNDESCREMLYCIVLAITLILKPDDCAILYTGLRILNHINLDPSFTVRKLYNKMAIIYRLPLNPSRPLPLHSGNKRRRQRVSNEHFTEWKSTDYKDNEKINSVSVETPANVNSLAEQSFQSENEVDVHSGEYMEVETHYSELVVENNQCNGEEVYEMQSSSQCQDDVESEEEEEEEDGDEDEEERSICEEEISQEAPVQELHIPTTRKGPASPPPVQISSGTVHSITEPEFDELASCSKSEEIDLNITNNVNGSENVVYDEPVPSSSTQVTNENGEVEEDDLDEENEEEEELIESLPAEKKVESLDPPAKRQKTEVKNESEIEDKRKENTPSPTLEEMKADFENILPSVEDVKSGKVQLSTS